MMCHLGYLWLLLTFSSAVSSTLASPQQTLNSSELLLLQLNVTMETASPVELVESEMRLVSVTYRCPSCRDWVPPGDEMNIVPHIELSSVANVVNYTMAKLSEENEWEGNGTVILQGVFLGKTSLTWFLHTSDEGKMFATETDHKIIVLRQTSVLDVVFIATVSALVGCNTVAYACALDMDIVREHLKNPFGIVIGFVCQFGCMPVIAYGLAKAFKLEEGLAFGLVCYGSSPGGGASNVWTLLLDGDINLSIAMTFISVLSSLGMTSMWVYTLGGRFTSNIVVPFENIVITLASFSATCVIGLGIQRFFPRVAKILTKIIKPMAVVIIVYIVTVGTYTNLYIFNLMNSWHVVLSALLVSYSGYLVSFLLAVICRRSWKVTKTIMIETGIQNGGLAVIMVRYSLPQPDGDLATVAPVTALMTNGLPLMVCLAIQITYRCCKGQPVFGDATKTPQKTHKANVGSDKCILSSDSDVMKSNELDSLQSSASDIAKQQHTAIRLCGTGLMDYKHIPLKAVDIISTV